MIYQHVNRSSDYNRPDSLRQIFIKKPNGQLLQHVVHVKGPMHEGGQYAWQD